MTNYLPPFPETPKEKLYAPPLVFCDNWNKHNGTLFWGLLPQEVEDKIIEFVRAMLRNDIKEDLFKRILIRPVSHSRGNYGLEYRQKKHYLEAELEKTEQRLENTIYKKPSRDGGALINSGYGYVYGHSGRNIQVNYGSCLCEIKTCYNSLAWKFTVWNTSRQWNDGDISGGIRCRWEPKKKTEWEKRNPEYIQRNRTENWEKNSKQFHFYWKGGRNQERHEEKYYSKEVGMINWRHSKKHLIDQVKKRGYHLAGMNKMTKQELARTLMSL